MKTQIENPALLNSRFVFDEVLFLDVNFHRLNLTRGGSYLPLPEFIANKKAIINPRNEDDDECFKWAVITALHHAEIKFGPERIYNLKKFVDNYDWSGLSFPTSLKEIKIFEVKNNISVNEGNDIYICRKGGGYDREVDLMLIDEEDRWHYTAIKSLSRLLTSRNTKHKCKQHFCRNCLQGFALESSRDEHYKYCINNEIIRVDMPRKKESILKFCNGQNQLNVPFVIYMDFKSILEPIQGCRPDPMTPYTKKVNKHTPSGFWAYSTFAYGEVKDPLKLYKGKDCIEKFYNYVKEEAKRLNHMFPEKPMDPSTKAEVKLHRRMKECHIYYKKCTRKDPKVRDHCHYTEKYRGPMHKTCNLMYKIPPYIPVVFRNLSSYDAHLFIKELGKKSESIKVIAKNKEDNISFSTKVVVNKFIDAEGNERHKSVEIRSIDSLKFMASSLDSLVKNLVKSSHKFFRLKGNSSGLLTKKGIYPYEYMSSWEKFSENPPPPPPYRELLQRTQYVRSEKRRLSTCAACMEGIRY